MPTPRLAIRGSAEPVTSLALVLHGGRARSFAPATAHQLTAVRMIPFARSLRRAGLTVWSLGYRYRGWNGPEASPVPDARWALDEVRHRHGDIPVVLIGHSMGGRTALRVAGDPLVRGVAALAPWLPDGEPITAGCPLLITHGTHDRVTEPAASRAYAERARAITEVEFVAVPGENHALLRRPAYWHRLATGFAVRILTKQVLDQQD